MRGRVRTGFAPGAAVHDDGVVVVDVDGVVAALGPAADIALPADLPVAGDAGATVIPGIVDAHVHLTFGAPAAVLAGGVVAVRDLGAPPAHAAGWRTASGPPLVAVSGPILTAPGGYPGRSWGADGTAHGIADAAGARAAVRDLAASGVDVVKIAFEPADGAPVPSEPVATAVVAAAHDAGLAVTAHALSVAMVERALAADVDELSHVPVERLPAALVEGLATRGTTVVSTLVPHLTRTHDGLPSTVQANAAALVAAGVPLAYGTDLGNTDTTPGVSCAELELLAAAGLGRTGALVAATQVAAGCAGLRGRAPWQLLVGSRAAALVLDGDPAADLSALASLRRVVA